MSNKIKLTSHQQGVFDNIIKDINTALSKNKRFIASIQGPAGVGKTIVTAEIIKHLLNKYVFKKLRVSTPTHKALKVVNEMIPINIKNNKNFSSSTIHSFLKLKMDTVEDKIIFVEDLFAPKKDEDIKILLIDESSMISDDIFNRILKKANTDFIDIVLFVGDSMQLPPVDGENNLSPVYTELDQYCLTEVVRQAEDNPILHKATSIRKCIETLTFEDIVFVESSNIIIYNDSKTWVDSYINNPNINNNNVITAFTNNTVNKYNNYIRNIVNKATEKLPKLLHGEYIVLQEAYEDKGSFIANGEVIQVDTPILNHNAVLDVDYWQFNYKPDEDADKFIQVNILDDDSIDRYKDILNSLANVAMNYKRQGNHFEAKKAWKQYWGVKNKFVDIKYNYAYTTHKLQGSSFDEVYINMRDIIANSRDYELLYRLVYVALTRARFKVHILQ